MRNNKIISSILILMLSWVTFANVAVAAPQSNPSALMQFIADNMLAGLKQNKATLKTRPQVVYNLAYKYIVPYADLAEMAKHVLPPQTWNSATSAQRAQFQKEFTTTLIRTYASSLTSYNDQTIKIFPARDASGRTTEVHSQISSPDSQPIQVTYSLVRNGSNWRLYDLSVEGVSMLESFRSQFADILSQGNIQQLLQRMSNHNGR